MIKHQGRYYLTYAAAGTEHRAYAMGAYIGSSPLGSFRPQARNPIFRTTAGLVTGTSHGSIIKGPGDRWWVFYTIAAGAAHGFERRVGMDLVEFDAGGEITVPRATSTPQWLPGRGPDGRGPADTGWDHLNGGVQTLGSSNAPNLSGRLAVDSDLRTWWQPAEGDAAPTLTSRLYGPATIRAVRIAWRDIGLDTNRGVLPGPYRYRVELQTAAGAWQTVLDRTASDDDLLDRLPRDCTDGRVAGAPRHHRLAEGPHARRGGVHRVRQRRAQEAMRECRPGAYEPGRPASRLKRNPRIRPLLSVNPVTRPLLSREKRRVPVEPRKTSRVSGSSVTAATLRRRTTSRPSATSMR